MAVEFESSRRWLVSVERRVEGPVVGAGKERMVVR